MIEARDRAQTLDLRPRVTEPVIVTEPLVTLPPRVTVMGCPLDDVDLPTALELCEHVIRSRGFAQHMAINVAKLMAMRDDPELRAGIENCELITADGLPVVWASRLLKRPLPERVAGIDLMHGLMDLAATRGFRIYVLGARLSVLEAAVEQIRRRHPGIEIAGYRDGYYADSEEAAVAEEIRAAGADILFVAMSSPRKEYFLANHGRGIDVPLIMGVGGAIDIVAGIRRRAPMFMQQTGLEWLFRLAQEPRRLAPRYMSTNARFAALLARELLAGRVPTLSDER